MAVTAAAMNPGYDLARSGFWSYLHREPEPASPYGDRKNRAWAAGRIAEHGKFGLGVLGPEWRARCERETWQAANRRLTEMQDRLYRADLRLSMDDQELRDWAKAKARHCRDVIAGQDNRIKAVRAVTTFLEKYGLEFPATELQDDLFGKYASGLQRVKCDLWWRRTVRRLQARELEEIARDLRMVHAGRQSYCSDFSLARWKEQKARNRALLEEMLATNEEGDEYTLQELSDLSVSNPEIRRCELMVRIAGFEQVAKARGYIAEFYTITCPSKYHPIKHKGGENARYTGASVREAQAYLCAVWSRIRAALHRRGIGVFGFRVVEPHHDGCPHWHLLLFMDSGMAGDVRDVVRAYALAEDGKEMGAAKYRFKAERIDPKRGSAAGYIAKYISKNINGAGMEGDRDLFGDSAVSAAQRITAWASRHGIRQFQQIGGPSVTVWRELRRLGDDAPAEIAEEAAAADAADWAAFVELMGGPFCGRDQAIKVCWWQEVDPETGEILDPVLTRYGEAAKGKIIGLVKAGTVYCSRFYRWTVERVGQIRDEARENARAAREGLGDALERLTGGVFSGPPGPPWSSVNNCTGEVGWT